MADQRASSMHFFSRNPRETHTVHRAIMRFLIFSLSLVCFIVAITSFPTIHLDTDNQGSRNERLSHSSPTLHRQEITSPMLSKRAGHNLQIHHVAIQTFTIPFINAAAALAYFYNSIVHRCAIDWAGLPQTNHIRITNGFFSLTLYGNGGHIPWTLIAEMAGNMYMMTQLGFVGTYDLWYINKDHAGGVAAAVGEWTNPLGTLEGPGVFVQFRVGLGV